MEWLGKKIQIEGLADEPFESRYIGQIGVVESAEKDPWGDLKLEGTWSGISLYPDRDKIKVLEDAE